MKDLDLDTKSFDELTEAFFVEFTTHASEPATNGALAIVWDAVRAQDALIISMSKRLEQALIFIGTYADVKSYSPGDVVRRQGSLWKCTAATSGAFNHGCWELILKRGDAR